MTGKITPEASRRRADVARQLAGHVAHPWPEKRFLVTILGGSPVR
jgi:hypothetical protein